MGRPSGISKSEAMSVTFSRPVAFFFLLLVIEIINFACRNWSHVEPRRLNLEVVAFLPTAERAFPSDSCLPSTNKTHIDHIEMADSKAFGRFTL